jgi:predicted nuclease of predicted toxin-antitoxin system
MKIKLDENLPFRLATSLQQIGHDVHTTHQEGLTGSEDMEIFKAAQEELRFLITEDLDFSDVRKYVPGSHCGILIIRLHAPARRILVERICELFRTQSIATWTGCLVVATELKVRVVRPPAKEQFD